MKYDFFKDIDLKYGLDCAPLYSKMFQGVKFIPKTCTLVLDEMDKDNNKSGYITVDVKDPNNKGSIIKLYISIFNYGTNSFHVRNLFFRYNYGYELFVISDIHIVDSGFEYKYECYNIYSQGAVCEKKDTSLPRPEYFKELNLTPDVESTENIPEYFTKDVISHITQDFYMDKQHSELLPSEKVRVQSVR